MHNAAFAALGLDDHYELRPAGAADAPKVLDELTRGVFAGFNVTTPLKTVLAPAVELRGPAIRARAVNTLWREGSRLVGTITDVDGVAQPLAALGVSGGEALIVGSGGAARAAALALESLGLVVHLTARRPGEAQAILDTLGLARPGKVVALDDGAGLSALAPSLAVIVQATPLGREGPGPALPWERVTPGVVAFEMLYRPRVTGFLTAARQAGGRTVEGWQMLVAQGARSFELWTGRTAPRDVMSEAVLAKLAAG
jgi:shikimate dehydrogenase